MAYASNEPQFIPTLFDALQTETVDTLKKLAALAGVQQNMPVRKANLVEYIKQRMACLLYTSRCV